MIGWTLRALILSALGLTISFTVLWLARTITAPTRPGPDDPATAFTPPVLAGRGIDGGGRSGGVYARRGNDIVLTTTSHSIPPGAVPRGPGGVVIGTFAQPAFTPDCPDASHRCMESDMSPIVLKPDAIPWGHLNVIDLGSGGQRIVRPGTQPLTCAAIRVGDRVEVAGSGGYAVGTVIRKSPYLLGRDRDAFPCMIVTRVLGRTGDSGGIVLVNGAPAGVASRSFGGLLAFTPLAEGLDALGLTLCTTPDCGLVPPATAPVKGAAIR